MFGSTPSGHFAFACFHQASRMGPSTALKKKVKGCLFSPGRFRRYIYVCILICLSNVCVCTLICLYTVCVCVCICIWVSQRTARSILEVFFGKDHKAPERQEARGLSSGDPHDGAQRRQTVGGLLVQGTTRLGGPVAHICSERVICRHKSRGGALAGPPQFKLAECKTYSQF